MSDEGMDRQDEREGEDVQAHGFDAPHGFDDKDATEEPPDVEAHQMGAPVDAPVD